MEKSSQSEKHTQRDDTWNMRVKMEWVRTLSQCSVMPSEQGKTVKGRRQQKRTHQRQRSYNAWCLHADWHQNYAHRFPSVSGHFTHCWACRSGCRDTNSLVVNAPNLFTFNLVGEFLVEVHTAKMEWGVVREEIVYGWTRKGQCSCGEACAFNHDPNRKGKGKWATSFTFSNGFTAPKLERLRKR